MLGKSYDCPCRLQTLIVNDIWALLWNSRGWEKKWGDTTWNFVHRKREKAENYEEGKTVHVCERAHVCVCVVGPDSPPVQPVHWDKKERCERGWKCSSSRPPRWEMFCEAKERDPLSEALGTWAAFNWLKKIWALLSGRWKTGFWDATEVMHRAQQRLKTCYRNVVVVCRSAASSLLYHNLHFKSAWSDSIGMFCERHFNYYFLKKKKNTRSL